MEVILMKGIGVLVLIFLFYFVTVTVNAVDIEVGKGYGCLNPLFEGVETYYLFYSVTVTVNAVDIEVGKGYGCNLKPLFEGEEIYYGMCGGDERSSLITFSISPENAEILRIETEAIPSPLKIATTKGQVIVNLPPETEKYSIQVYFKPLRSGLIDLYHTLRGEWGEWDYNAIIWAKVLPQGAPLPFDVNWDGKFDEEDVAQVLSVLPQNALEPDRRGVDYYRCDVDGNSLVNKEDLVLVRKRLGLNPYYDFNGDGKVDIYDLVALKQGDKRRKEAAIALDLNKDGRVDIRDLVLKAEQDKDKKPNSAPARLRPKVPLASTWGKIKR